MVQRIKNFIWKFVVLSKALLNYSFDLLRYLFYSNTLISKNNFEKLIGRIIAHYHVIEKGLSLKEPRLGFGQPMLKSLCKLLHNYLDNHYVINHSQFLSAVSSIKSYIEFHKEKNFDVNNIELLYNKIIERIDINDSISSSTVEILKGEIIEKAESNFQDLAFSRHSIRNFTGEEVDLKIIKKAINIAQTTPTSCNRQTSRVYILNDKKMIEKALSFQTGNRGFGHLVNKLLVITSELNAFDGIQERNLCYVDGGMFAMSLIYALQYLGLGTCALNWAVDFDRDVKLRKSLLIEKSHNIIVLIAVGHLPDKIKVASSIRYDTEDIISIK